MSPTREAGSLGEHLRAPYFLEINGPAGAVPVLIDVAGTASGLAGAGGTFAVASQWGIYDSPASPRSWPETRSTRHGSLGASIKGSTAL